MKYDFSYDREAFGNWVRDPFDRNPIASFCGYKRFRSLRARFTDPALFRVIRENTSDNGVNLEAVRNWIHVQVEDGFLGKKEKGPSRKAEILLYLILAVITAIALYEIRGLFKWP